MLFPSPKKIKQGDPQNGHKTRNIRMHFIF